mgnify:CR=1 FL=1
MSQVEGVSLSEVQERALLDTRRQVLVAAGAAVLAGCSRFHAAVAPIAWKKMLAARGCMRGNPQTKVRTECNEVVPPINCRVNCAEFMGGIRER